MILSTCESSFEMTILGYQYPDAAGETYDANWLLIQVDARSAEGEWHASDPCLLTYEATRLAGWLEALADWSAQGGTSALSESAGQRGPVAAPSEPPPFRQPVNQNGPADPSKPVSAPPRAMSFLEPVLLFRVVSGPEGEKLLRVHFGGLIKPSWIEPSSQSTDRWLDFPLADVAMLRAAGQRLKEELRRYPSRAEF